MTSRISPGSQFASVPAGAERYLPSRRAGLAALAHAAEGCRGCPLYRNATQVVFGEGGRRAKIVMIGEQPGDQEDRQGRPFVGPAGHMLDRALADAGIDRSLIYLTNAVKHFKWIAAPAGKRRLHAKPTSREIGACRPWLDRELEVLKPAVVVCLGATAGQSLFGPSFRVGAMRPKPITDSAFAPYVIATIHPSALLRMPDKAEAQAEYRAFVKDLQLALRCATK